MIKCLIDSTEHESLEALHKYIRKLGIKQETYYTTYYNKKDPYNGQPIPFKSVEQYLAAEFLNKITLKNWIRDNEADGKKWSIEWLKKRKEEKNLTYPPTQVELRSLLCPSMHYYNTIGGYYNICREIGYKDRFNDNKITYDLSLEKSKIIIDTREQTPLKLSQQCIAHKLNCGDYGLEDEYSKGVFIERKSLVDFINTLSSRAIGDDSNYLRFSRELERAKDCGEYIVMLVENDINDALSFNYFKHLSFIKVSPDHIFKNLRDLLSSFDNFQALFVSGRKEAANAVKKILLMGESVKTADLQFKLESDELDLK